MVNNLIVTESDLNKDNEYKEDSIDFDGDIVFSENLGVVKVRRTIKATQSIIAKTDTGIEAGYGIEAGSRIIAGFGIIAGLGIEAGSGIIAGSGIEAGNGIKAGDGIEAGWEIEAGWSVITKFEYGVKAKFISCLHLAVGFNVKEEQEICAEIRKGKVLLGKVIKPKEMVLEDLSKRELINKVKELEKGTKQ